MDAKVKKNESKVSQHENSLEHLKAFEKWKETEIRFRKDEF